MNKSAREKEAVLNVFASLVRPLTRVAFEYGISASEISGVVRRTYIQSLEERLMDQKRVTTDARIAVVAGLTKSDVSALREATRAGAPHSLSATVSLDQVTNLLTVWHTLTRLFRSVRTCARAGSPANARFAAQEFPRTRGSRMSRRGHRSALDELVAAGSVEVVDNSTVRCLSRAYVPKGADVKRIERMGRFLAVIAANFVHNLLRIGPEPVYFERAVVSDESLSDRGRDQVSGARRRARSGAADGTRHVPNTTCRL